MSVSEHEPLPRLHVRLVQEWVGASVYRRGQWYHRQGRVLHARRQGRELRALCQGQAREPYRVWVRLDDHGIAEASCTCPAGRQGRCKHVAAVLLLWVAEPEAFPPSPDVAARLASWPRSALVALILGMIDRYPDLEAFIPLYQPAPSLDTRDMDKGSDC